jgi:thioredoxin reductase
MKDNYDVVIIGSGMGGLSSSVRLTHMGMKVLVVSCLKTASMILKEEGVKEPLSDVGVIDAVVTG